MLKIENLSASYGDLRVLFDISMHIEEGEIISLVGSNGAGKTTLLRVVSGLLPITSGKITFMGKDLVAAKSHERADWGISHIPQGRGILRTLTVKENLVMGAYIKRVRPLLEQNIEKAFTMFPILKERQNQIAGSLSGGEQQMLAIARALMMESKLMLLDEPSLGLAPKLVEEVFNIITEIAKQGISVLVVEQNLTQALGVSSRGYVLETGRIVLEGSSEELMNNEEVRKAYLGV